MGSIRARIQAKSRQDNAAILLQEKSICGLWGGSRESNLGLTTRTTESEYRSSLPLGGLGGISVCVLIALVQLGGLEPPTSCSTDRRSNQLSYNCILASRPGAPW